MCVLSCQLELHPGLGVEEVGAVMSTFHERSSRQIELANGYCAERLRDGCTAYFGFPRYLPSAAEHACAQALGLVASLGELNEELKKESRSGFAPGLQCLHDDIRILYVLYDCPNTQQP